MLTFSFDGVIGGNQIIGYSELTHPLVNTIFIFHLLAV